MMKLQNVDVLFDCRFKSVDLFVEDQAHKCLLRFQPSGIGDRRESFLQQCTQLISCLRTLLDDKNETSCRGRLKNTSDGPVLDFIQSAHNERELRLGMTECSRDFIEGAMEVREAFYCFGTHFDELDNRSCQVDGCHWIHVWQ